jgi:hypothetical protein
MLYLGLLTFEFIDLDGQFRDDFLVGLVFAFDGIDLMVDVFLILAFEFGDSGPQFDDLLAHLHYFLLIVGDGCVELLLDLYRYFFLELVL